MNAAMSALLLLCLLIAIGTIGLFARCRRLRRHALRGARHRDRVARQRRSQRASGLDAAAQYHAQVRASTAPVLVTSPDGGILAASSSVVEMFGFAQEQELRRGSIVELYANPLDRAQLSARLNERGHLRSGEFRMKHRDGHDFHVLATVRVVDVADGSTCYESVLTDITLLREAADERARLATQLHLARKLELIGQLASGIAHEINTPLQFVGDNINFLSAPSSVCASVATAGPTVRCSPTWPVPSRAAWRALRASARPCGQ